MIVGVLGLFLWVWDYYFFLSIAFLVNVKVAERYEYPVINRKQEKKPESVFINVLLAQGEKLD